MKKVMMVAAAAAMTMVVSPQVAQAVPSNTAVCSAATNMVTFAGYISCAGPFSGNISGNGAELTQLTGLFGGTWTWQGKSDDTNSGPFTTSPTTAPGSISFDTPYTGYAVIGIKQSSYYSYYYYNFTSPTTTIPFSSAGTASGQSGGLSHIGFYTKQGGGGITNVVPEPSTYLLMATGLLGLGIAARRRRKV